ncbi:hypothetical protein [Paraburkholderia adhaesiva]|uniref:hypothetical protein n=1 Tax=Paraburkholderia adhaesiva TaxID=2883244 RepID=UPI001F17A44D|nr:hypothetical protein [Paraburkholderia adhaesiva]
MKHSYTSTAEALRDALRHTIEAGSVSSLAPLHQTAGAGVTLEGTDASVQAARIRRQLERLPLAQQAILVVSYAPRWLRCNCRRPCCAGHYPNPEWANALNFVVATTAALFISHVPNVRLREALVANLLTHTAETQVALAQRCGAHRTTVAEHSSVLSTALIGTRTTGGAFDAAFARIDERLHEAGIVVSDTETQPA